MHCPFCGHVETKVNDSRLAGEGRQIRRRRECLACGERFTTFETAELVMPVIVKGDRSRESFDEGKLRGGMEKALEKRPVPREAIDEAVSRVTHRVRTLGDREVPARVVGELVMDELRQLDEVAYVRFASVYRQFQDVEAFHEEIEKLRRQRAIVQAGEPKEGQPGAVRSNVGQPNMGQPTMGQPKRTHKREANVNRDQLSLLPGDEKTSVPGESK